MDFRMLVNQSSPIFISWGSLPGTWDESNNEEDWVREGSKKSRKEVRNKPEEVAEAQCSFLVRMRIPASIKGRRKRLLATLDVCISVLCCWDSPIWPYCNGANMAISLALVAHRINIHPATEPLLPWRTWIRAGTVYAELLLIWRRYIEH